MGCRHVLPWKVTEQEQRILDVHHPIDTAEIERATKALLGKALRRCTRAADLASFSFGEPRNAFAPAGDTKEVGEYALHVQCAWRIAHKDEVVVGSRDLYYPADYGDANQQIPDGFDWDRDPNRRDKLLRGLFEGRPGGLVVGAVSVGRGGSLCIELSDDFSLEVFPDDSLGGEYWRLFKPQSDQPHFVLTGRGIEGE